MSITIIIIIGYMANGLCNHVFSLFIYFSSFLYK